jgi:hypothetical protein
MDLADYPRQLVSSQGVDRLWSRNAIGMARFPGDDCWPPTGLVVGRPAQTPN